jgi:hypothetical protein
MTDKYYPVTKEELDQIKNDCVHPETDSCDGCEFDSFEPPICRFIGANALMDEVLSRPDPLALLESWVHYYERNKSPGYYIGITVLEGMIKQIRENPDAVRQQGIKDGWYRD